MSPLVARQWPLQRGAQAAVRTLYRPRPLPQHAVAVTLRSYAEKKSFRKKQTVFIKKSVTDDSGCHVTPTNSAIIIPTFVTDIQPNNVVYHINPVLPQRWLTETFAVFLVTPSFVPWLHEDKTFLERAVRKLYRSNTPKLSAVERSSFRVNVLCAVVDKLPAGRHLKEAGLFNEEPSRRTRQPPVSEAGFEGIAYATLPADSSVPITTQSPSETGAIDFTWLGRTANSGYYADTLRLPLANTVFQTGTLSTMTLSTWSLPAKSNQLVLDSKVNVSYHTVKVAGRNVINRVVTALSIPLIPLTLPRQVEGCMGNIIRQLIGPDEIPITASSELEQVVPQFFKSRGEPAQATSAWALVMSASIRAKVYRKTRRLLAKNLTSSEKGPDKIDEDLWDRLWKTDPPMWNSLVSAALAEGARLHRVLSGGGGWGKKAGLLSLDPVPVTDGASEDSTSTADGSGGLASVLTPVVRDGDWMQFFISPTPAAKSEASELNDLDELAQASETGLWAWELGCIPSTMDSLPGGSWQHATPSDKKKVIAFQGSFGALTEKGLTMTRRFKKSKEDEMQVVGATMVDVPFSRFSAVRLEKNLDNSRRDAKTVLTTMTDRNSTRERLFVHPYPSLLRLPRGIANLPKRVYNKEAGVDTVGSTDTTKKAKRRRRLPIRKFATMYSRKATHSTDAENLLPIRKLTSTPASPSHIATDSYLQSSRIIARLTNEHRAIMHEIRHRQRQPFRLTKRAVRDPKTSSRLSRRQDRVIRRFVARGQNRRMPTRIIRQIPRLRQVRHLVVRHRFSRRRNREQRRALREVVVRQVVDQRVRPGKDGALRTFWARRRERRMRVLEERVGGWLGGGGGGG